jgi:hypothetical protein
LFILSSETQKKKILALSLEMVNMYRKVQYRSFGWYEEEEEEEAFLSFLITTP